MSTEKAVIVIQKSQSLDLGFFVLCATIFLMVFNIVCVFIFYRKWKKRLIKCRSEYQCQGRSEYLSKHKPQKNTTTFKRLRTRIGSRFGARLKKNYSMNNRNIKDKGPVLINAQNVNLHYEDPMEGVNSPKRVRRAAIKRDIDPGNVISSNRKDFSKPDIYDISDVYSVVKKNYLLQKGPPKHLGTEDGVQTRENVGRVRVGTNNAKEGKEMDNPKDDCKLSDSLTKPDQKLDSGQGPASSGDIQTLSTLFEIHSEHVVRTLSRLKSLERKGN